MGLLMISETINDICKVSHSFSNEEKEFIVQFAFKTSDKELTNKLIVNTDTSPAENGIVPASITGRTNLVQQSIGASHSGTGVSSDFSFWKMSQNNVNYNSALGATKKGWYFDLPVTSERVLRQMSFFDGSNNLMVYSLTPAYGGTGSNEESCEPAGTPEIEIFGVPHCVLIKRSNGGFVHADKSITILPSQTPEHVGETPKPVGKH